MAKTSSKKIENEYSNLTIEERFKKLDKLIEKSENKNASLEDSMQYFKEGSRIIKSLEDSIDKIEKELVVLGE